MLFNSFDFLIFLPIVFFIYWFVLNKSLLAQNLLILVSSYVFYAWWDWRFLFLLMTSTLIDYTFGLEIFKANKKRKRKLLLWLSILNNLVILFFFKYFNFFSESFSQLFSHLGFQAHPYLINLALPVGISFYTFHGMSYVFDIYNEKIKPEKDFIKYSGFVCFFPLLVAGPIERATHLLPQFSVKKKFDYAMASDGLRQILWGLFKKIVIADNCALLVNNIFDNYKDMSGSSLALGSVLFAVQIYCDFSGYTDIALGTAKLFGFSLIRNFAYPYFSRDIAEFWRRWHISLSSWFRDYLYIPLGGSRGSVWNKIRNTFIIFLVSGFWHGANWTFIFWGGLNALYFLPLLLSKKNRTHLETVAEGSFLPGIKDILKIGLTFGLTCFAWIFFRSATIDQAFYIVKKIFSHSLFTMPQPVPLKILFLIFVLFLVEWIQRGKQHAMVLASFQVPVFARWSFYLLLSVILIWMGAKQQSFIYFQF
jgi:alginate O-acetyltransferase complex protein AlgI